MDLLIVEDDPIIRDGMSEYLSEWGYHVIEARDGREALSLFNKDIKVVLLDIQLPFMNGLDVLKEISKRKLKTKVIFLSGFQEFSYAKEAVTYGAVDYLLKPVSVEELENAINRAKDQIVQEQPEAVWKIDRDWPDIL